MKNGLGQKERGNFLKKLPLSFSIRTIICHRHHHPPRRRQDLNHHPGLHLQ